MFRGCVGPLYELTLNTSLRRDTLLIAAPTSTGSGAYTIHTMHGSPISSGSGANYIRTMHGSTTSSGSGAYTICTMHCTTSSGSSWTHDDAPAAVMTPPKMAQSDVTSCANVCVCSVTVTFVGRRKNTQENGMHIDSSVKKLRGQEKE